MSDTSFLDSEVRSHRLLPLRTKLLSFNHKNSFLLAPHPRRVLVCKPPRLIRSKSPMTDYRMQRVLNTSLHGYSVPNHPNLPPAFSHKRGVYTEEIRSTAEMIKSYDISKPVRMSMRSVGSTNTLAAATGANKHSNGQDTAKCTGAVSMLNEFSELRPDSEDPSASKPVVSAVAYNMEELADIITPKNKLNKLEAPKPLLLFITEEKTPRTPKEIEIDIKKEIKQKQAAGDVLARNRDADPQGFLKLAGSRGATFVDYLELKMMLDRKKKNGGFGELEELIKKSNRKQAISFGEYKNLMDNAKKTFRSPSLVPKPILSKTRTPHRAQSNGGVSGRQAWARGMEQTLPEALISPALSPNPLKKSVTFSKYNTVFIFARDD